MLRTGPLLPGLRLFLRLPVRVRLPFGSWWLATNDACSRAILRGEFEPAEQRFVEGFLQSGMTVLDIGAHHGFYTLLASQKIGDAGGVIAFEPSERERANLLRHLELNQCTNVKVEAYALAATAGDGTLFVVQGKETGCNSLRRPQATLRAKTVAVEQTTLDSYLEQHGIGTVDFIKLDVEGGELDALRGAATTLQRQPRPMILCEVQEERTQPWGYAAAEIILQLREWNFSWYRITPEGRLRPLLSKLKSFDGNYVAVPEERVGELRERGLIE